MKYILLAAFAAAVAVPAFSQNDSPDTIHVQGESTVLRWSERVSLELDRHLRVPAVFPYWKPMDGTASVRFSRDRDGSPTAVSLYARSGERRLDRAAIQAVSRMRELPALPAHLNGRTVIQANIIFASDQDSLERQQAALRKREARRFARQPESGDEPRLVVLELTSRVSG